MMGACATAALLYPTQGKRCCKGIVDVVAEFENGRFEILGSSRAGECRDRRRRHHPTTNARLSEQNTPAREIHHFPTEAILPSPTTDTSSYYAEARTTPSWNRVEFRSRGFSDSLKQGTGGFVKPGFEVNVCNDHIRYCAS
jgi:hypothetical protein